MIGDPRLGEPVAWSPAATPVATELRGQHVVVRPVNADTDAEPLYAVSHLPDGDPSVWTYLSDGPYESVERLHKRLEQAQTSTDRVYFTVVRAVDQRPLGWASYLRITPVYGVLEIGHLWFAPELQRTTAATEAVYLLASHAFDQLGYRRLEWKCNALNAASRKAAERFGFSYEGTFRKHQIVKGHNHDTAWYAITEDEWPAIRAGFQAWLAPENFDRHGNQIRVLRDAIRSQM